MTAFCNLRIRYEALFHESFLRDATQLTRLAIQEDMDSENVPLHDEISLMGLTLNSVCITKVEIFSNTGLFDTSGICKDGYTIDLTYIQGKSGDL